MVIPFSAISKMAVIVRASDTGSNVEHFPKTAFSFDISRTLALLFWRRCGLACFNARGVVLLVVVVFNFPLFIVPIPPFICPFHCSLSSQGLFRITPNTALCLLLVA